MQTENRCKARKRDGEQCGNPPMHGGTVCRMHGGASPRVRAAAAKRIEAQEVQRGMVTLGLPIDIDPTEALLQEVRRTAGHVAWLSQQVQALDRDDLFWSTAQHEEGTGPEGPIDKRTHKAGGHAVYELYIRERDHLAKVSALAIKAGVDQRRIELAEAEALMLAGVVRRILAAVQLTPEQQALANEVAAREFRALDQNPGA